MKLPGLGFRVAGLRFRNKRIVTEGNGKLLAETVDLGFVTLFLALSQVLIMRLPKQNPKPCMGYHWGT